MIDHIRRWYIWQRTSRDSRLHKFLVLIGLESSPSMVWILLPEEVNEIADAFKNALRGGKG